MKRDTGLTALVLVWLLAPAAAAAQDCGETWDRGQANGLEPAAIWNCFADLNAVRLGLLNREIVHHYAMNVVDEHYAVATGNGICAGRFAVYVAVVLI